MDSKPSQHPRPRQVAVAVGVVLISAALLVISAYDSLTTLRSLDTRAALRKALDSDSARQLGVTVDQATSAMHVMLLVAGAGAAAALVLGVAALQRHRRARLALTCLAPVVVVAGMATDPILSLALGAGVATLWTRAARDWFAGRAPTTMRVLEAEPAEDRTEPRGELLNPHAEPTVEQESQSGPEKAPWVPPSQTGPTQPGAGGWPLPGQQPPSAPAYFPPPGWAQPQQWQPAPGWQPMPGYGGPAHRPPAVPRGVQIAAVLTWVLSAVTAACFVLVGLALAVQGDAFLDRLMTEARARGDLQVTRPEVTAYLWIVVVVVVLWSLAACVLAWFAWRRHGWARILLTISAVVAGLLSVLAIRAVAPVVILAACIAVIVLLFSRSANDWYAGRSGGSGGPGGYGGYADPNPAAWQQPGYPYAPPQPPYAPPPPAQPPYSRPDQDPGGEQPPEGKPPVW